MSTVTMGLFDARSSAMLAIWPRKILAVRNAAWFATYVLMTIRIYMPQRTRQGTSVGFTVVHAA